VGGSGPQGIFRSCIVPQARHGEAADAAEAGCIGKSAVAAGADKTHGTDPPAFLKPGQLKRAACSGWLSPGCIQYGKGGRSHPHF